MADQPTVRAQQLGEELRKARLALGLSLVEVGKQIGASEAKMSRIESGHRGVQVEDAAGLCAVYRIVGTHRKILLDLAETASELRWLQPTDFETNLSTYRWLENRSNIIVNYETNFIPGLLQTGEYIQAVQRAAGLAEDEVERRKLARVQRQRIIRREHGPAFAAIVDQEALTRPIGGQDVQRRQLEYLVEVACQLPIDLRVIPKSVPTHPGLDGPFVKWEFADRKPVIYIENRMTGLYMEDNQAVTTFSDVLGRLNRVALSVTESVHLIAGLAAELE